MTYQNTTSKHIHEGFPVFFPSQAVVSTIKVFCPSLHLHHQSQPHVITPRPLSNTTPRPLTPQTPTFQKTHRLNNLSTGQHRVTLSLVEGVSTSHSYCHIARSSHDSKPPWKSFRAVPLSVIWVRKGSSEAGKTSTKGAMVAIGD